MDHADADQAPPSPMELKQHGRSAKSLKHKSKSKRPAAAAGGAGSAGGADNDQADNATATGGDAKSHHAHHHHHHHAHRHGRSSSGAAGTGSNASSASKGEDAMRELLTSKIAELQVGGDDLDTPIDLSGIFSDETLPAQTVAEMNTVLEDAEMSADGKMDALAAQIKKASDELAQLQQKISEINAKCILLKQRKNAATTELVKTSTTKAKLEQLCRELQKQNKLIVSESRRIADEEDQKRRDLSAQFQKTIEEVSAKMDQQGKDYVASLRENESLQRKLKSFLEQYTVREEHFQKQLEAKDLTVQLAEAKLAHQMELTARESEKVKLALEKAKEFSDREMQLQAQLNSYSEKFDIVQETLNKSNQMFTTFRDEMDKMAKHTKKLEKENTAVKKKCAEYDTSAIATIQEKVRAAEETQKYLEKIKKLESLCRHLQAERNSIRDGKQLLPESA